MKHGQHPLSLFAKTTKHEQATTWVFLSRCWRFRASESAGKMKLGLNFRLGLGTGLT